MSRSVEASNVADLLFQIGLELGHKNRVRLS